MMERGRFPECSIRAAYPKQVPNRSPLRYPGGKTWLTPHVRAWLGDRAGGRTLLEPFAGGATTSLTAVSENRVSDAVLVEAEPDIAAFWRTVLAAPEELAALVLAFELTKKNIDRLSAADSQDDLSRAFRTLVLNRTRYNGIPHRRSGMTNTKDGKGGFQARWYPATLERRIRAAGRLAGRVRITEGNGMRALRRLPPRTDILVFIDAPYTGRGGTQPGQHLYNQNQVDHAEIFRSLAESGADFLMTYDEAPEIIELITEHAFHAETVTVPGTRHRRTELIVTPRSSWKQAT